MLYVDSHWMRQVTIGVTRRLVRSAGTWCGRALLAFASLACAEPLRAADEVTFSKDIAPILLQHCAVCHRPGEIGPFSLLTYRDARQHLTQIADVTLRRVMPPWKPDRGLNRFIGDRSLTDAQIARVQEWVKAGAPEGDRRDLPALPVWTTTWQLGAPDLVVTMETAYPLQAEGGDVFRTFVLPIPTTAARYVRAIEFRPGNPRAVHHANIGIDRTRSSRRLDAADAETGYSGGMVPDASYPPGYMLGWTPGQSPRPSPEGMAWRLEPGSDLVAQLHMQPTGKPEAVQVSVGFFFTDERPTRTPIGLRLGSETIEIAAGEREHAITDEYEMPVDVDLLAVQPHAHNLARLMEANATRPDGTVEPLITIRDWDFRWQEVYRYAVPVPLPKGTRVTMRFTYDNSTENPRNPARPPRRVVWGQNTTDEMGDLWLQLVPKRASDLGLLNADISRKTRGEDIAAYTKILRSDPLNPLRHDVVGMLHLQDGLPVAAAASFRESLRLNPESAPTRYNLGLSLAMMRNYADALEEFREAARLDPEYAEAHNNLGAMQHLFGLLDEAALSYRRALAIKPENAEAHGNLGRLLIQQRDYPGAVAAFQNALAITADASTSLSGLAWVRAAAPDSALRDPQEALRLAERAATVSEGRDPSVLDTLAVALAASGEFERAVATAQAAVARADALGMLGLGAEIRERLALFERRQPYLAR